MRYHTIGILGLLLLATMTPSITAGSFTDWWGNIFTGNVIEEVPVELAISESSPFSEPNDLTQGQLPEIEPAPGSEHITADKFSEIFGERDSELEKQVKTIPPTTDLKPLPGVAVHVGTTDIENTPFAVAFNQEERDAYLTWRLSQEEQKQTAVKVTRKQEGFFTWLGSLFGFGNSEPISDYIVEEKEGIHCPDMNDLMIEEEAYGASHGASRSFEAAIIDAKEACKERTQQLRQRATYYASLEEEICTQVWDLSCNFEKGLITTQGESCEVTTCLEDRVGEVCSYSVGENGELTIQSCSPRESALDETQRSIICHTRPLTVTQTYYCA